MSLDDTINILEKTIIISQEQNFFPSNNQVAGTSSTKFNWQKWFNYFFGK